MNLILLSVVIIQPTVATKNSTYMCWDDFDISDDDNDLPDLPRKTISDGSTPWNNFKDLVIGQR